MGRLSRKLEMIEISSPQMQEIIDYISLQEDVLALYLYGSYGTGYQNYLSDVDFAVLPLEDRELDIAREARLLGELQGICKNDDVNLVNLRRVPVTLQMQVLDTGRLLYCRDEIQLADFKEYVICRYCDFEPDFRTICRDYDMGLREEYL